MVTGRELRRLWNERDSRYMRRRHYGVFHALSDTEIEAIRTFRSIEIAGATPPDLDKAADDLALWYPPGEVRL